MDLRQIMSFMSIYEERNFSRAAQRTGTVQPALSLQIKRLEEEFGIPLFERGSRGVVPTNHGKAFYRLCEPIRRDVARARQQMAERARPDEMIGTIRCGLPPTVFKAVLGPVVAELLAKYPHLDFAMREGFPATVSSWVLEGEVDIGMGSWRSDLPGLEHSMVYEEEVVLVSSTPRNSDRFAECTLSDLGGIKLMISSERQLLGRVLAELIGKGQLQPAQTMVVESFLGIISIAQHSDWCAFVPVTGILDELVDTGLSFHRITDQSLTLPWHVVHRRGDEMTTPCRTFVSRIIDGLEARKKHFHEVINGT